MAKTKLVMRVGALSLMGGAAALFAAQAGVLPGFEPETRSAGNIENLPVALSFVPPNPDAETPAALASILAAPEPADAAIPDAFVSAQGLALPQQSGFAAAPVLITAAPAVAADAGNEGYRPAAFHPAAVLAVPGARPAEPKTAEALSPFGLPCGLDVAGYAAESAMVAIDVAAPCHPDAVVTVTHSGMTIAARTDAVGLMTLDLPALEAPAFVTVTLPDGSASDVTVDVPDLAGYDRVAIAWSGDLGVELHALEDDASWMSAGHIRPDAPRGGTAGSFLTLLGDKTLAAPRLAQIYTMARIDGPASVNLTIDAPVTLANCTQSVEARVLRVQNGSGVEMTPLGFTYPTCDAAGDTLVLQNVFGDLRLAAN
jgi:hypothetical protein